MKTSTAIVLALATSLSFSCKDAKDAPASKDKAAVAPVGVEPPAAEAPPTPEAPPAPAVATPRLTMQMHFAHAITAKDTILFGDLDVAMSSLRWLAENGASDGGQESWEPHVGRVRRIAQDALSSKKVETMAMAVAQLARECGSCHAALGAEPEIAVVKSPPGGEDFKDHMIGHKWALDRMWAGLTTPSSELWISGAGFLAEKPSHLRNLSSYGKNADMAVSFATQVHTLSEEAVKETQSDRRMAIFGRFLAACAGCHAFPASAATP
jgi:hypothetical protein